MNCSFTLITEKYQPTAAVHHCCRSSKRTVRHHAQYHAGRACRDAGITSVVTSKRTHAARTSCNRKGDWVTYVAGLFRLFCARCYCFSRRFAGQVKPHGSGRVGSPDPTRPDPRDFKNLLTPPEPTGPARFAQPVNPPRPARFEKLLTRPDPTRPAAFRLTRETRVSCGSGRLAS